MNVHFHGRNKNSTPIVSIVKIVGDILQFCFVQKLLRWVFDLAHQFKRLVNDSAIHTISNCRRNLEVTTKNFINLELKFLLAPIRVRADFG